MKARLLRRGGQGRACARSGARARGPRGARHRDRRRARRARPRRGGRLHDARRRAGECAHRARAGRLVRRRDDGLGPAAARRARARSSGLRALRRAELLDRRGADDAVRRSRRPQYFPRAEIIELHNEAKKDAPSGTARLTAQLDRRRPGDPLRTPAGPRRAPGGPLRRRGRAADDPPRHDRPRVVRDGVLLALEKLRTLPPGLTSASTTCSDLTRLVSGIVRG